jgi:MOSC domain-containing protein YiiM
MRLVSLNVGFPREVGYQGRRVLTGIFKEPVAGRVRLNRLNLDGDGQADLRVHGGADKAVYAYPLEHYAYWARALGRDGFPFGQFGENFTVADMLEESIGIGDVFRVGTARVQVSQPRTPCFKLDLRMDVEDFRTRFTDSQRTGFYLRVLEEGEVAAGDACERLEAGVPSMSVLEIFSLRYADAPDRARLERAARLPALSASWRAALARRLAD